LNDLHDGLLLIRDHYESKLSGAMFSVNIMLVMLFVASITLSAIYVFFMVRALCCRFVVLPSWYVRCAAVVGFRVYGTCAVLPFCSLCISCVVRVS
jgi:hypothetical protein